MITPRAHPLLLVLAPLLALGLVLALADCSSSSAGAPPDASSEGTGDAGSMDAVADVVPDAAAGDGPRGDAFEPASHQPFPQVPNQGGPRLTSPAVVNVTFAGDTRSADFEGFATWLVASSWLTTVGAEYGIGHGSLVGAVALTDSAPTTETSGDMETYLATQIQSGALPKPPGGLGDALYMVYLPSTTNMTTTFVGGVTAQSCTDWDAYHGEAHAMGLDFSYAVMADCGASGTIPGLTDLQSIEVAASHELIEASTDAFPITRPAYQLVPDPTSPWFTFFQFEVEVADLCEVPSTYVSDGGYYAQRIWSNAAAAAGEDPCVPSVSAPPYFNTSATPDAVQHAAPGATATFQLQPWSVSPVAAWNLSTDVLGTLEATTALTTAKVNNGGTSTLTVTVPVDAEAGTTARIILWSEHSTSDYHAWVVDVVTP